MKVEVIKGVSHSIELIHGETSVCITPDEAQNLIAQLLAVVPFPADVEEVAEMAARRKYPYEGGTKGAICQLEIPIYREGFKAGAEWQRERLMKEAVGCMFSITDDKMPCLLVGDRCALRLNAKKGDYLKVIIIKKEK